MKKIKKVLICLCAFVLLMPAPMAVLANNKDTIAITTYEDDFSTNCVDFSPAMKIIGVILLIVKIVIPIIIIVVTSFNLVSTVTSGKSDDFNKIIKKAVTSLIAAALIFFAGNIIDAITNVVTKAAAEPNVYNDIQSCKQCLFHPLSKECTDYIELSSKKSFGENKEITTKPWSGIGSGESITHTHESGAVFGGHGGKFSLPEPNNEDGKSSAEGKGLWVAHQKNTVEKINDAISKGFHGIEVDVIYSSDKKDFILYHANTEDNGAKLTEFLDIAKSHNILAVLDLKTIKGKYSELLSLVKKHYSMEKVVFMAFEETKLTQIYNIDSNAKLWLVNGSSTKPPLNIFDKEKMTEDLISKLDGVAVMAMLVDQSLINWAHERDLKVEAFSYLDYMYDNVSANQLREWGVDYISAGEIDEKQSNNGNRRDEIK